MWQSAHALHDCIPTPTPDRQVVAIGEAHAGPNRVGEDDIGSSPHVSGRWMCRKVVCAYVFASNVGSTAHPNVRQGDGAVELRDGSSVQVCLLCNFRVATISPEPTGVQIHGCFAHMWRFGIAKWTCQHQYSVRFPAWLTAILKGAVGTLHERTTSPFH